MLRPIVNKYKANNVSTSKLAVSPIQASVNQDIHTPSEIPIWKLAAIASANHSGMKCFRHDFLRRNAVPFNWPQGTSKVWSCISNFISWSSHIRAGGKPGWGRWRKYTRCQEWIWRNWGMRRQRIGTCGENWPCRSQGLTKPTAQGDKVVSPLPCHTIFLVTDSFQRWVCNKLLNEPKSYL